MRTMYHTQEKREKRLISPIICKRKNAWLGIGYYFWDNEIDAIHWGNNGKRTTSFFEIYKANVDCENVLDTVFNEEHYTFWVTQIEKAAKFISKKTGIKAKKKEINQYFKEKANWSDVTDGILFQDLPFSEDLLVKDLNYRKRIQIAVYNLNIISNFALHFEMECD
ncbi:MAG: hypothetical protein U9R42_09050 [Bacteroidota bacterium]|nr:hypothetical protein [Bacteroidota bacterium]